MQLTTGAVLTISRPGVYLYQVDTSVGTAKLTWTDQGGVVSTDITNSSKSADFTGTLSLGKGTVVATLTGDATAALTFADH
jgi:hypothetical protein